MSLINKMLQDLEDREPEASRADSLHPSVRPAPVHRKMHPAWLVALASTMALVLALAGFSWHRMRARIAEIPLVVQQAQLPLKMADSLSILPSQADENPVEPVVERGAADAQPELASDEKPAPVKADGGVRGESTNGIAPAAFSPPLKLSSRPAPKAIASSRPAGAAISGREEATGQRSTEAFAEKAEENIPAAAPRPAGNDLSMIAAAKQVHELSPHEKAENEYRKAAGLIQQGRSAEAIATLKQGLAFDPKHAGARQALIGLLLEAKRADDAMNAAKEGLSLDNTQIGLAMILARMQVDNGDLQSAIDALQRSLPSGAENAEYQAFYAALMQRSGKHREAIDHYMAALRIMPRNGVWWMGLGISLQAENRIAEAKNAYGQAKSSGNLSPELAAFVGQRLNQLQR